MLTKGTFIFAPERSGFGKMAFGIVGKSGDVNTDLNEGRFDFSSWQRWKTQEILRRSYLVLPADSTDFAHGLMRNAFVWADNRIAVLEKKYGTRDMPIVPAAFIQRGVLLVLAGVLDSDGLESAITDYVEARIAEREAAQEAVRRQELLADQTKREARGARALAAVTTAFEKFTAVPSNERFGELVIAMADFKKKAEINFADTIFIGE